MKRVALTTLALATVAATPTRGQEADTTSQAAAARRPLHQFPVGETLLFDGKWGLIKLGRASMQVVGVDTIRGEPAVNFRFRLRASLLGIVSLNDRFDSWVGVDDFLSRRFTQDFDEAGRARRTRYEIFPDSGLYWQEGIDTARTSAPDPLDDTAFFYWVRTLDLEPGERHEFGNYFRPDRNPVVIEVISRDTVDVPAGRFATIVVRPIIRGGMFDGNKNGRLWISDDERRLIVQMKTDFGFGAVTLRLTEFIDPRTSPAIPSERQHPGRASPEEPDER